jgi:hypothetical protein
MADRLNGSNHMVIKGAREVEFAPETKGYQLRAGDSYAEFSCFGTLSGNTLTNVWVFATHKSGVSTIYIAKTPEEGDLQIETMSFKGELLVGDQIEPHYEAIVVPNAEWTKAKFSATPLTPRQPFTIGSFTTSGDVELLEIGTNIPIKTGEEFPSARLQRRFESAERILKRDLLRSSAAEQRAMREAERTRAARIHQDLAASDDFMRRIDELVLGPVAGS